MNEIEALDLRAFESELRRKEALKEVKEARKRRRAQEKEILRACDNDQFIGFFRFSEHVVGRGMWGE